MCESRNSQPQIYNKLKIWQNFVMIYIGLKNTVKYLSGGFYKKYELRGINQHVPNM